MGLVRKAWVGLQPLILSPPPPHTHTNFTACPSVLNSNNGPVTCSKPEDVHGDYASGWRCAANFYRVQGGPTAKDQCLGM